MTKFILYEIDEEMLEDSAGKYGKIKQGTFHNRQDAESRRRLLLRTYKNVNLVIEEK